MVKTIEDFSVFGNGPVDRVTIEVSIITRGGRKISARIDNDLWWGILADTSKSMMQMERELIELLIGKDESPDQLALPVICDATTGEPVKTSYLDWD